MIDYNDELFKEDNKKTVQLHTVSRKIGKPRKINSPKEMLELAYEYFEWCDNNPLITYEWNGKEPVKCIVEKMRPYTFQGLEIYVNCDLEAYRNGENNRTGPSYSEVFSRIDKIIRTQKFEGAAAGLLDRVIISRDIGLADKTDFGVQVSAQIDENLIKTIVGRMNSVE